MKSSWLRSRRFWLLIVVGILMAWIVSQLPLAKWFLATNQELAMLGLWAIPVFILLYLAATVLGLPNIVLILVAGSLFGVIQGTVITSIADTLGAVLCFFIGRTFARKWVKRWIQKHPKFVQLDQAVERKGWKVLLLTRLSPLVPSNVLNYGFSCTKVDFWQYTLFSWVGMLPVIVIYTYLGSFGTYLLNSEITLEKVALQGAGLLLAIGAALYITRLVRKSLVPQCPLDSSVETAEATSQSKGQRK